VEVIGTGAGVAAGLGAHAGGHVGDAERSHRIAERRGLAGGENDGHLGKCDAEGGDEPEQGGVRQVAVRIGLVLVVSGIRPHARESDAELRLPAMLVEILEVRCERESLMFPIRQSEQRADSDAPETARISPLRAIQPPVEILLRPRGVEGLVGFPVIGFLIDDEPFRTVIHEFGVLVILHRADLQREGREKRDQRVEAFLQVAFGNEFRMFPGDEEEIAETLRVEKFRLGDDLIHGERSAQDRRVAREAAVGAVVHALVGDVERREQPHRLAEILPREALAALGECFQRNLILEQCHETAHQGRGVGEKSGIVGGK